MMALLRLPDFELLQLLDEVLGMLLCQLRVHGRPELPSAPWQAAHTAVKLASPLARSGLVALAGAALAPGAGAAAFASAPADILGNRGEHRHNKGRRHHKAGKERSNQLHKESGVRWAKQHDSTMALRVSPFNGLPVNALARHPPIHTQATHS